MPRSGFIQSVVDVDNLASAAENALANTSEIPSRISSSHASFSGAVAKHNHQVGVVCRFRERRAMHVVVRGELVSVHVRHAAQNHIGRVVVMTLEVTSEAIQQTRCGIARGGVHASGIHSMDGVVAVSINGVLQLLGDGVDSLVPGDLLELALAALAHALHGVQQAVGAVQPATHGAAAQAGTGLKVIVAGVVGLHIENLAVARMPLEDAVAAAVDVALAPMNLIGGGLFASSGHLLVASLGLRCAAVERAAHSSCGSQACERAFDEGAARQSGLGFSHSPSSNRIVLSPLSKVPKSTARRITRRV